MLVICTTHLTASWAFAPVAIGTHTQPLQMSTYLLRHELLEGKPRNITSANSGARVAGV